MLAILNSLAVGCDTAKQYAINSANADGRTPFHRGHGGTNNKLGAAADLVLLPQVVGDVSPACLDGSPYGFYPVNVGQTASTKWTLSIEGGGWCYDEDACLARSKMALGTSTVWEKTAGCGCMNIKDDVLPGDVSPMDTECNCVYMPYGDGASFSGYRAKPWPVPNTNETLTFRGIKNFDATVEWALDHGMRSASEIVLTGGSAGGLSTFLHMDRLRAVMARVNPRTVVRGAPVVGFFLDHGNFAPESGLVPNTPNWEVHANYTAKMKWIYAMQNLTFGADGGLMAACGEANAANPHYCFMRKSPRTRARGGGQR